MTKCCNQHDRCYDTCGREKHDCDEQFHDCLETICRNVQRTLGLALSVQGKRLSQCTLLILRCCAKFTCIIIIFVVVIMLQINSEY